MIEIIIKAHTKLVNTNQVQQGWEEDRITSALFIEINRLWRLITYRSTLYDFVPQPQYPLFPKQSKVGKAPTIDFVFVNGYINHLYFAFECKLVDYGNSRLITEYIKNGMYRFISGYYSNNTLEGGMLGYTFSKNIPKTVVRINLKISERSSLNKSDCLKRENTLSGGNYLYKSKHTRISDGQLFTIRHLFLAFP